MEKIRRILREMLGWNSWIYHTAANILNFIKVLQNEGISTSRQLTQLKSAPAAGLAEAVKFTRLNHPFYIRPGTKDISVAINNFVREEYGALCNITNPKVLVDCGAYIGDTTAYFLSRYPGLRSIALEPMDDSREMAKRNLDAYGNRSKLLPLALTADGLPVRMSGKQTAAHATKIGDIEVSSITLFQILAQLPEGHIDILKMDIEGAEGEIFAQGVETWLHKVGLIIVETHGPEITHTIVDTLNENGWMAKRFRNLLFCRPVV